MAVVTPPVSYPGVYIQEVPSGVRTIVGVGTSIGLFIGASRRGPINRPRRCVSYGAFSETFGEDHNAGDLAQYVRLFFLNGGTDCWVMRIAHNPAPSKITLLNEANVATLELTAKDMGLEGENIRALVTYGGAQPEVTFNMELYVWELQAGKRVKTRRESWKGLSMDPTSPSYAPIFLTQNSKLVDATDVGPAVTPGVSQSGRPVAHAASAAGMKAAWGALIGTTVTRNSFLLSANGSGFIPVDLGAIDVGALPNATFLAALQNAITGSINNAFIAKGLTAPALSVVMNPGPPPSPTFPGTTQTTVLTITSTTVTLPNRDILIRPAASNDLAVPLMLGAEQGGVEIGSHAMRRPSPSGITLLKPNLADWKTLATLQQQAFTPAGTGIKLDQTLPPPAVGTVAQLVSFTDLVTNAPADLFYRDNNGGSPNDNNDGLRDKLGRMATAINNRAASDPLFRWTAQVTGTRLTMLPTDPVDDNFFSALFAVNPVLNFLKNVKVYTLGAGGFGIGQQTAGTAGSDGTAPDATDYDNAYPIVDREVDLFNLMVLPPVASPAVPVDAVYANASVFCQQRRAFLLMDSPASWTDPQSATAGLTALRIGLVKDYSAVFFPRIAINQNGLRRNIGAAGALAGLFGRIDATRGVWKAPAGTEADFRGIVGLDLQLSDRENGVLNPRAINTLRVFPSGIVNWGARTNQGDDNTPHDYKYIPIRRLALYIEESLYRGLKWVVFEPNDEPLWAQIRLNVGAFMHNLFRQGAFQGATPRDAYFVKCDAETTTQNDRNLGIVNIWVGFAPLKPAEFVILYLQQMAGQIET